jgi:hypothetical protein
MAGTTFHADLLSSNFPYNFRELGSSIVVGSAVESPMQTPASMHGNDAERQAGFCQGYFLENVLPITRGYSSVAYTKLSSGPLTGIAMDHMLEVRTNENELIQVGVKDTKAYIASDDGTWKVSSIYVNPDVEPQVAVVRGVSYLWFGTFTIFQFNSVTQEIDQFITPALGSATIQGISSGGSQLIVHDEETIYWSAVLDAQDFTPSLATGAGSTKVLALRGNILCCKALGADFIIYTQYNAIHARSTGNLQFPFNFVEVSGSIGLSKTEHIASNTNTGVHVVYTTAGFQQISAKGAEYIWPELSEGISRGILVNIDPLTDIPAYAYYDGLAVRMSFVADRWICVSLGIDPNKHSYTDIYIYDIALARWGRLKVTHTCVFQWGVELVSHTSAIRSYQDLQNTYATYADLDTHTPALIYLDITDTHVTNAALTKNRPALFSSLGNVSGIVLSNVITEGDPSNNGGTDAAMARIILGKYKISRNHGLVFQWLRCNKLTTGTIVLHGHDYNGEFVRARSNLKESPRHKDTWYTLLNADAISVHFQGVFTLTDLTVSCTDSGTMNSYAAPLKKFDRLLLSNIYPMEAYELTNISTEQALYYSKLMPTLYVEPVVVTSTASISTGSLSVSISYQTYTATEADKVATASYTLASGSLTVTIAYVTYTGTETDKVSVDSYSLTTGSLVVTIVYIDKTLTEADTIVGSYTLTAGALT